jgi:flagellar basal body-associated protein FliL
MAKIKLRKKLFLFFGFDFFEGIQICNQNQKIKTICQNDAVACRFENGYNFFMLRILLAILIVLVISGVGAWFLYFSPASSKSPAVQKPVTIEDLNLTPTAGQATTAPKNALEAVKQLAAQQFNVPQNELNVVSENKKEWPDTCLGLNVGDKTCTKTVTQGYEITIKSNGNQIIYRTNSDGSSIRIVK